MFAHDKLHAYGKSIAFAAAASAFMADWENKHAVTDQLGRATDSLVLNLAEGARLRSGPSKQRSLDYAIGSCLECAACLGIAQIKGLLARVETDQQKQRLCEIMRMLVGLRKAWETWEVHEDPPPYGPEMSKPPSQPLFHHETLDVFEDSGLPGSGGAEATADPRRV